MIIEIFSLTGERVNLILCQILKFIFKIGQETIPDECMGVGLLLISSWVLGNEAH
mgnify:CR=1 FL=1